MHPIDIQTRDGRCPSYVYRPAGPGPWPAVLVYMAAERHWQSLLALLDSTLQRRA